MMLILKIIEFQQLLKTTSKKSFRLYFLQVIYDCDSITGECAVQCSNGAKPNVESVKCKYRKG